MTEFIIRPWKITDLKNLVKYVNNWKIAKNMTDKFPHPYSELDGKEFIAFATKNDPIHIFAIEFEREAVGGIGIHIHREIYTRKMRNLVTGWRNHIGVRE